MLGIGYQGITVYDPANRVVPRKVVSLRCQFVKYSHGISVIASIFHQYISTTANNNIVWRCYQAVCVCAFVNDSSWRVSCLSAIGRCPFTSILRDAISPFLVDGF